MHCEGFLLFLSTGVVSSHGNILIWFRSGNLLQLLLSLRLGLEFSLLVGSCRLIRRCSDRRCGAFRRGFGLSRSAPDTQAYRALRQMPLDLCKNAGPMACMTDILSARQLLDHLVSFPTVSSDTNLPLIHFVRDYFAQHGIESVIYPNEDGNKAGLVAQVGPNVAGGVALSGHSDVVPVEGQDWSTDPWQVVENDGRLYGRGTCDMKGFVALAIEAMVKAKSLDLKRPLQFALSRDEEVGLLGAPDVARGLLENYAKAEAVIVGEPTEMQVVTGHKSCDDLQFHVRGKEVHSSRLHEGVSAVMCAARFVEWVRQQNIESQAKTPTATAALYDPPFTTLHVGVMNGGTAHNITAKDCYF